MVRVVSLVAVYVTLECTNVVGDYAQGQYMILVTILRMVAYRTVGSVSSGNYSRPVASACLSPCIHGREQARSRY